MYKCRSCNGGFSEYRRFTEQSGEKWYACPLCGSTDFVEIQSHKVAPPLCKTEAISTLITALSALNEADLYGAREIIIEFICDILGESPFIYKDSLLKVTDSCKERLLGELITLAEVC